MREALQKLIQDRPSFFVFFGIFLGGMFIFFKGFRDLKKRRVVEDIPTSTVRGLALGLVELIGKPFRQHVYRTPFSNRECVFCSYSVDVLLEECLGFPSSEEKCYVNGIEGSNWAHCIKGSIGEKEDFIINDGTGEVVVLMKGAHFIWNDNINYEKKYSTLNDVPDFLYDFLKKHVGILYKDYVVRKKGLRVRFREQIVTSNDSLYVIGTARKQSKKRFHSFNQDHELSDVAIEKIDRHEIFVVSNYKQNKVINTFDGYALGWALLGGFIVLFTLFSLIIDIIHFT
jgi:hypothetical protein